MGTQSSTGPKRGHSRYSKSVRIQPRVVGLLVWICLLSGGAARSQSLPLLLPSAVAFDSAGNLYVADAGGHVVREVSAAGAVSTIAGTGMQGYGGDGGAATAARLDSPGGVAVDAAGNVFIADTHNHRVREIAAGIGIIRTIAGSGTPGFAGDTGLATAARLDLPTALACDGSGNLFVADTNNHRVRRIALGSGVITTVAGDGTEGFSGDGGQASSAAIDSPRGVAVDSGGNLYIADTHNARLRRVALATGVITTIAGSGSAGFSGDAVTATGARLSLPDGVGVDAAGNLYVADRGNHRVRKISASGVITTVAGNGTEGFAGDGAQGTAAMLDGPAAVAASATGAIGIADSGNQRVRVLDTQMPAAIHTAPWLGTGVPVSVAVSGSTTAVYGSASVMATVSGAGNAGGAVALEDTTGGAVVLIGNGTLDSGGAVSFSGLSLSAGAHTVIAVYPGDAAHAAAQSAPFALTITPKPVSATSDPVSILYGQSIPALTGSLTGVLPQDGGKVSAQFFTAAGSLSPVGTYPIQAVLSGPAAGNYTVSMSPAMVTVAQAPTSCGLNASTVSPAGGSSVTLNAQAVSSTTGVPTGSMTLLDGSTVLANGPLTGGAWSYSLSTLASGTHTLTAAYSGNANFLPSTSAPITVDVGAGPDFTLASSGVASQMVVGGTAASFSFSLNLLNGGPASPINLAVQGLPRGATASLNPISIPPGGAISSFTLTIQTPLAGLDSPHVPSCGKTGVGMGALTSVLLLPFFGNSRSLARRMHTRICRGARPALVVATCILLASFASGCGDRVNSGSTGSHASTYTITVTGTATGPAGSAIQHSANVTLEVL